MTHQSSNTDQLLETLYGTVRALVRNDGRDLTVRQLAVFLICYHQTEPQTVRGLAEKLNIPRAAISRNLGRLEKLHLVERQREGRDPRSMRETRTARGQSFLRDLSQFMANAAKRAEPRKAPAKAEGDKVSAVSFSRTPAAPPLAGKSPSSRSRPPAPTGASSCASRTVPDAALAPANPSCASHTGTR